MTENSRRLDNAEGYSQVWEIVKETTKTSLGRERRGMMLFLDDLSLQLGAYHPLGTNNIVLNRALVEIAEAATNSRRLVNAFVYVLLLHEYLHALGYVSEAQVRPLVYEVAKASLGEEHTAAQLAKIGPWSLLKGVPLSALEGRRRVMEIVKDFEKTDKSYIV